MADGGFRASDPIILKNPIRAADLFCGAGGFSTALTRAVEASDLNRPLRLVAVNHWQIAIDTHQFNHPAAAHFCADLEHLKPLDAVPDGVLDILLAAPACTFHSRARGGKPVHDQQRMDPWHVVRWCTELRVHRLVVENVPEFMDWGPCDVRTGRPIKARKGEYFRAWVAALKAIGFRVDFKVICCADLGDATTRERFFLIARSDKKALRWPDPGFVKGGRPDLLGERKPWRAAAECIDWDRPGNSIFTRKRQLVKNTLSRLLAGAKRNRWPQQHVDALQAILDGREPRLHVTEDEARVIAAQLGVPLVMATGAGGVARAVDQPIPTVTAGGNGATPHFAEPVIVNRCSSVYGRGSTPTSEPAPTVAASGGGFLSQPIILHKMNSTGGRSARGVEEPVPTVTTNGAGTLAVPIIAPYYGAGSGETGTGVDQPLPTQGTKDRFAVAAPTVFRVNQGHGRTQGITSGSEPMPTITASESLGVATPLLVPNFGERPGQEPRTHNIHEPTPAITAGGHIQLAQPFIAQYYGAKRNGDDRTKPIAAPLGTQTTENRFAIAVPAVADGYYIDILYRMLHWSELARATSFIDEGHTYNFTGTATEITKQIGNAVPIRTGSALCAALLEGA